MPPVPQERIDEYRRRLEIYRELTNMLKKETKVRAKSAKSAGIRHCYLMTHRLWKWMEIIIKKSHELNEERHDIDVELDQDEHALAANRRWASIEEKNGS